MKVLIADLFSTSAIEEMQKENIEVVYDDKLSGEALTKAMAEVQPSVLVVRSTKVPKETIDANPKLQLVVRAGAGYDTIDFKHCSKQGVYVANCPGKNAHAVAELAMGLILSIDRRIAEGVNLLNEGKWKKGMFANCTGIKGKTIGVIGCGNIAKLVIKRALAFEMNVLVHSRTQCDALAKEMGFEWAPSLEALLQHSDIVSLHVPSTPETKGMVNAEFLGHMKPDAMLINTARGNNVVDEAILQKLESCPNFWYGTDVFNGEPAGKEAEFDNAIAKHPRVYGTHHCGASTKQAEGAIGEEAKRIIMKFVSTGQIDDANCVNLAKPADINKLSIRHYDKVGVLSHVFSVFEEFQWNCQELQNIVFQDREACVINITFTGDTSKLAEGIEKIKSFEHILDVNA